MAMAKEVQQFLGSSPAPSSSLCKPLVYTGGIIMHGISSPYPAPLFTFPPVTSENALLTSLLKN